MQSNVSQNGPSHIDRVLDRMFCKGILVMGTSLVFAFAALIKEFSNDNTFHNEGDNFQQQPFPIAIFSTVSMPSKFYQHLETLDFEPK